MIKHLREQNWIGFLLDFFIVVAGILLALQINNWNDGRKDRVAEQKILAEILGDLEFIISDLENDTNAQKVRSEQATKVLEHLLSQEPPYEGLVFDIIASAQSFQFTPRSIGYETLKFRGVELISNELLRKEIVETFSIRLKLMELEGREFEKFDNPTLDINPYIRKYIRIDKSQKLPADKSPSGFLRQLYAIEFVDYEKVLNDSTFPVVLQKTILNRFDKIRRGEILLEHLHQLKDAISAELQIN